MKVPTEQEMQKKCKRKKQNNCKKLLMHSNWYEEKYESGFKNDHEWVAYMTLSN